MNVNQHLDFDALNTLKEIMEDDFVFLIETFLQDSASRVETLAELINGQDSDAIRRAAHSFKGSCSNVGALHLASLCGHLEHKGLNNDFNGVKDDFVEIKQEFSVVQQLLHDFLQ